MVGRDRNHSQDCARLHAVPRRLHGPVHGRHHRRTGEALFPLIAGKRTTMPVVPEGARRSRLNLNAVHGAEPEQEGDFGGCPASCVPDRCTLTLDRRFPAEESLEEVRSVVLEARERAVRRRPALKFNLRELHSVLPCMTDESAPVAKAVNGGIRRVLGAQPDLVVPPGS